MVEEDHRSFRNTHIYDLCHCNRHKKLKEFYTIISIVLSFLTKKKNALHAAQDF